MKKNVKHPRKISPTDKTTRRAKDQEAALRKEIERLKPMIVASRGRGYLETYSIAVIVQRIVDGKKQYGLGTVTKLEAELGTDTQTLYGWAVVARAWKDKADFAKLISRRSAKGIPLSWSHLKEIAVAPVKEREEIIRLALRDSLSVRGVRELVTEKKHGLSHAKTAPVTISGGATTFSARVEALVSQQAAWREELRLLPSDAASQMAEVLNAMRESCEATIETIEAVMQGPSTAAMPVAPVAYAIAAAA